MLSVSILGIFENIKENINKLDNLDVDYFHIDVMDGKFVPNKTWTCKQVKEFTYNTKTKLDVHLMVNDILKNVDDYSKLNPSFITFHYEATSDVLNVIKYIKSKGIKVGLSIKPDTKVECIKDFLKDVDLVLVMSVEPGFGGQTFIENSTDKINELYELREKNNFHYLIEVDGGINNISRNKVKMADILVVGSYITKNNYEDKIKEFK